MRVPFDLSRLPPYFVQGLRWGTAAMCGFASVMLISFTIYMEASRMSRSAHLPFGRYLAIIGLLTLAVGIGTLLVIYSRGLAKADKAERAHQAELARERAMEPRKRVLNGTGDKFALEIRGVGLYINGHSHDWAWKHVSAVRPMQSILPDRNEDYPKSSAERTFKYSVGDEIVARSVALDAMHLWPVPGFTAQPTSHPSAETAAGQSYSGLFRDASLVYSFGIWVDDINGEDASPLVDKLFAFFDAHPEVPQAIVMTQDGDTVREFMRDRSIRRLEGPHRPAKPLSIVALLVSRTDRVDRFVRPYLVEDDDTTRRTPQQTEYDYIKLYNFYWREDDHYAEKLDGKYLTTTMSAAHWASRLPALLPTLGDKGVPGFQRTDFLPLRWTNWQVDLFDNPPIMGYLHRPITVRLRDDDDKLLTGEAQVAALREGWQRAVGTLPIDDAPMRVFRDTRNDQGITKVLGPILKEQTAPLVLDDMTQDVDIGTRIGDTGIASPFVQIALATMASYHEGGPSATVHRRENGDVTFTMVSPPDEKTKAAWEGDEKRNPFTAHQR